MRKVVLAVLATLAVFSTGASQSQADASVGPEEGPGTVIGGFFRELVGYLKRSDQVDQGDVAPDFELVPLRFYDFDLGEPDASRNAHADVYQGVRLSAFRHIRPVALIFGSYT